MFVSIAEETARLKTLVNTLMDISHTNSRPDELRKEEIDLTEQLRDFCEFMQPAFEEKGLQFRLEVPDHPLTVLADKSKFQRVVSNLLENALKFTERGAVTVTAAQQPDGTVFKVKDTGCGISEADCPQRFQPPPPRQRARPGAGPGDHPRPRLADRPGFRPRGRLRILRLYPARTVRTGLTPVFFPASFQAGKR